MNNAQLINQDSGDYEYFTPIEIVNAAREVMGYISLDPASSKKANERLKITAYFDNDEHGDGLYQSWRGRIWMNHPFSRGWKGCADDCKRKSCENRGHHIYENLPSNEDWINKLVLEYVKKNLLQACYITFAATSEKWFQPLLEFPQCYLSPRTNYYLPDGTLKKGVTKGSVVTYLGDNVDKFIEVFDGHFGKVKI